MAPDYDFAAPVPARKASDEIAQPWGVAEVTPIQAAPLEVASSRPEVLAPQRELGVEAPVTKASDEVANAWTVDQRIR